MKESVIVETASLWLVSAMDVSVKAMLLALLAGMALKLTRIADPNLRHRVWTGILVAMLALPVLSQILPSLRLPFAIDASWLIAQQGQSVVDEQGPRTPNGIQTEAVDPAGMASGDFGQMNEPKHVDSISDGSMQISRERSLGSNFAKQSQSEHELVLATSTLSSKAITAETVPEAVSNEGIRRSEWIAPLSSVILLCTFLLWMMIAVVLLSRLALALLGGFRLTSTSSSIALSDLTDLDLPSELLHVCGRSLQMFECPRLKVPVTVGVLAPRVYLPAEWLEWTHDKLVAVLTHERTHIERRDCAVTLLAEVNRCIFWFHPLAWWLKYQLSALAEAACDDAVIGTTGDRTMYARHLLEVASVVATHRGRVSHLGVSMARCSNVENRIRSILDFTRPLSQKLTNVTSASLLLVIVPIVVIAASLQTGEPSNSPQARIIDSKVIVPGQQIDMGTLLFNGDNFVAIQEPTKKGESKPGDPEMKPQNAAPAMKQVGPIPPAASAASRVRTQNEVRHSSIVGTIRDDAGKALSGVTLGIIGTQIVEADGGYLNPKIVLVDKTISTSDGRFELKLPSDEKKLEKIKVVAGVEGYGIQWRDVPSVSIPDSFELVLPKLLPIRLRLVDIEGRPAQGVSLAVTFLKRTGSPMSGQDFLGSLKDLPEMAQLWPLSQKTDSEGRCQILRMGNGIGAFLQVEGNDLFAPQSLMINSGEAEERGENDATFRAQVKNDLKDQELVMPLAPAQFFEGQITLADTGKPAAGVKVGVWASQQQFGSMVTVNGKTDDLGKYRINPEAGIRFGVTAYPAKGEPYLAKTIDNIPWGTGLKSKTIDIALPRGVLVRGRVLDAETKAPIAGVNVQYMPKDNNPNNSDDIVTGWQCIERTSKDGTFAISVLAGKGTLIVHGPRDAYVLKEMSGLELVGDRLGGDRNYANAFVPLELATGADPQELTVEIERGEKVVGKLVDENQALVDRAVMITRLKISALHSTWRGFGDELEGGKFELTNLAPGVEYKCSFLDPRRKLGATVLLRSSDPEPIVILKPCGTAKVRFVTSTGEPREGAHSLLKIVVTPGVMRYSEETNAGALAADEDHVANHDYVNYRNGPKTDADGRMELIALIPGATYRILGNIKRKLTHKDFTVEAGQTIDLGEIILDRE